LCFLSIPREFSDNVCTKNFAEKKYKNLASQQHLKNSSENFSISEENLTV
jgi:hypothetical protein